MQLLRNPHVCAAASRLARNLRAEITLNTGPNFDLEAMSRREDCAYKQMQRQTAVYIVETRPKRFCIGMYSKYAKRTRFNPEKKNNNIIYVYCYRRI